MSRTPGLVVPSAYSSKEELEKDLRQRGDAAGFTPFEASDFVEDFIEHYGVKGMKWGIRREHKDSLQKVGKLSKAASYKTSKTQADFQKQIAKAGGLHKMTDKQLENMKKRLEMEKKLRDIMNEDAQKRSERRKAALKILGEVGKIALPLVLGVAVNQMRNNSGSYRTSAFVSKPALTLSPKAISSR